MRAFLFPAIIGRMQYKAWLKKPFTHKIVGGCKGIRLMKIDMATSINLYSTLSARPRYTMLIL